MDGCSSQNTFREGEAEPGYYDGTSSIAAAVCCGLDGASCKRKIYNGACPVDSSNELKVTWEEAKMQCQSLGLRLCNSQHEIDQCCGQECGYDNRLVWSGMVEGIRIGIRRY